MSIPIIHRDEIVSEYQWLEILKSYRYELRPTKKQEVKMLNTLETCRHVHNWSLEERKNGWQNGG